MSLLDHCLQASFPHETETSWGHGQDFSQAGAVAVSLSQGDFFPIQLVSSYEKSEESDLNKKENKGF